MSIAYYVTEDYVTVWLLDNEGKKKLKTQIPKKDIEYVASRIMKELGIPVESAFDLAVYVAYLKVTWGL